MCDVSCVVQLNTKLSLPRDRKIPYRLFSPHYRVLRLLVQVNGVQMGSRAHCKWPTLLLISSSSTTCHIVLTGSGIHLFQCGNDN